MFFYRHNVRQPPEVQQTRWLTDLLIQRLTLHKNCSLIISDAELFTTLITVNAAADLAI